VVFITNNTPISFIDISIETSVFIKLNFVELISTFVF